MAIVEIELSNTIKKAIVDTQDKDLNNQKWYKCVQNGGKWVVRRTTGSKSLGRIILARIVGRPLAPFEFVGYWNGNPFDCRRSNLFVADVNQINHRRRIFDNNELGIKGVTKMKYSGRFRARIYVNGKAVYLGEYEHIEKAIEAYRKAAEKHYGEYAYLE